MSGLKLHIITFNVPYPPDYGGIIDSFYRIKTLHKLGAKIILHCFDYGRGASPELEKYCDHVFYYPRQRHLRPFLSLLPYVVKTRTSDLLLERLLTDDYPILFDGLHTTMYLNHPKLLHRKKFIRAHNIEHQYYTTLAKFEKNYLKKMFYKTESFKLARYERISENARAIFTVSLKDQEHFSRLYHNAFFIPSFHPYQQVLARPGMGNYILYHGDLSINENEQVASSLIRHVFPFVPFRSVIAGKNPSDSLKSLVQNHKNTELVENPSGDMMDDLISNAQVHLLPVLENNGLKLKLLHALYRGRHCIVNDQMVQGTSLGECCAIANKFSEMISKIKKLMVQPFSEDLIYKRQELLSYHYDNDNNGKLLIQIILDNYQKNP